MLEGRTFIIAKLSLRNCKQHIKSWIENGMECLRWRLRTQFNLDTEIRNSIILLIVGSLSLNLRLLIETVLTSHSFIARVKSRT